MLEKRGLIMNIVDIGILVLVLLSVIIGVKRGTVKGILKTLAFVIIGILSYTFKGMLGNWLMGFMPFFSFAGIYQGVYAVNIMFYQAVSFVVIYVLLYCFLSIIVAVGGVFDKVYKKEWLVNKKIDKILGALVGFIEGTMIAFVAVWVLSQLPNTTQYVMQSHFGLNFLERTPMIRTVFAPSTLASEEVYELVDQYANAEDKTDFTISALQVYIKYQVVTSEKVKELEDAKKLGIENITFN